MSLSERLTQNVGQAEDRRRKLFGEFGVIANPFPPAGQPAGHPHLEVDSDAAIERRVESFLRDHTSHVVVVEGEQGVGKTNLLSYYDSEFRKISADGRYGNFIVRYYSDPEPSFEGVLTRIFSELGEAYIREVANKLASETREKQAAVRDKVRNQDLNTALEKLRSASSSGNDVFTEVVRAGYEWMTGHRLLNRHRHLLGVHYRVDTLEAKTQILRDLVEIGHILDIMRGVFLLLDELEKQDYTTSKTNVLRFLLAVRALIDALPRHLFMMVALTPTAKNRYFQMVPAVQSRMQNGILLKAFKNWEDARGIVEFYISQATEKALLEFPKEKKGQSSLLSQEDAREIFNGRSETARRVGSEGVTPRDFLDELHNETEKRIATFLHA